ncbi:ORF25 [White sturgeon adenovirus 1]|uniref:ORF25 n=1 Tax=White sturgeon adenovirus 1 TaxID=2580388 RepID=A0A4P8PIU9_9ADEN|nr:ORF25 [White sturgeon adenovirus 1]QCQ84169.1 ORF25 [White sturgeon adenovirus 1]
MCRNAGEEGDITVEFGQNVTLWCFTNATKEQGESMSWSWLGPRSNETFEVTEGANSSLTIYNVSEESIGEYECAVFFCNEVYGETIWLDFETECINTTDILDVTALNATARIGTNVTLTCFTNYTGNQSISWQWVSYPDVDFADVGGEDLGNSSTLTFEVKDLGQTGQYECGFMTCDGELHAANVSLLVKSNRTIETRIALNGKIKFSCPFKIARWENETQLLRGKNKTKNFTNIERDFNITCLNKHGNLSHTIQVVVMHESGSRFYLESANDDSNDQFTSSINTAINVIAPVATAITCLALILIFVHAYLRNRRQKRQQQVNNEIYAQLTMPLGKYSAFGDDRFRVIEQSVSSLIEPPNVNCSMDSIYASFIEEEDEL